MHFLGVGLEKETKEMKSDTADDRDVTMALILYKLVAGKGLAPAPVQSAFLICRYNSSSMELLLLRCEAVNERGGIKRWVCNDDDHLQMIGYSRHLPR